MVILMDFSSFCYREGVCLFIELAVIFGDLFENRMEKLMTYRDIHRLEHRFPFFGGREQGLWDMRKKHHRYSMDGGRI